jgi:peroxiredoxin
MIVTADTISLAAITSNGFGGRENCCLQKASDMSLIEKLGTPVGSYAPDFELPGIDGEVHHLSRYLERRRGLGVIFMCNQCRYVNFYLERLKQIQVEFQHHGFTLIGINANDAQQHPEDSFENMKKFAHLRKLNFPYLWDTTQDVAQSFGAENTPEAFLIDEKGVLRYRGGIDDNPQKPEAVQVPYLQNAIAALLAGEDILPKSTKAIGSPIAWRNSTS